MIKKSLKNYNLTLNIKIMDKDAPRDPEEESSVDQTTPESEQPKNGGVSRLRRVLLKALGAIGVGAIVDLVGNGLLSHVVDKGVTSVFELNKIEQVSDYIEEHGDELAAKIKTENPEATPIEQARKMIDYLGAGVFAQGIFHLVSPNGRGHIGQAQYIWMIALTAIKHRLATPEGQHHLKKETASSLKAFGIISGTIVVAEGLNADLRKMYEEKYKEAPTIEDRIALMTTTASVLSPLVTTVGSAGIIREMSNNFAKEMSEDGEVDHDTAAVCVSHISNLSGFLLFGDPPFIAVCEKYGFKEGVEWQLKTMLPLALWTLYSSTCKLNYINQRKEGVNKIEAFKIANKNAAEGIRKNTPFLIGVMTKSLVNVAKYFTGADAFEKLQQDTGGIQVQIGEVIEEKLKQIVKLPFDPELDKVSHEHVAGLTRPFHNDAKGAAEMIVGLTGNTLDEPGLTPDVDRPADYEDQMNRLREAAVEGDDEEVSRIMSAVGMPEVQGRVILKSFQDFADDRKANDSAKNDNAKKETWKDHISLEAFSKATDMGRMQNALGHNMADVVDVFPFQAGCVPFLLTVFNDGLKGLESLGLSENEMKAATFIAIMIFSMFADNYVGCKVGLELMPEAPEIALIASIQGGTQKAIGNMENVAQYRLKELRMDES